MNWQAGTDSRRASFSACESFRALVQGSENKGMGGKMWEPLVSLSLSPLPPLSSVASVCDEPCSRFSGVWKKHFRKHIKLHHAFILFQPSDGSLTQALSLLSHLSVQTRWWTALSSRPSTPKVRSACRPPSRCRPSACRARPRRPCRAPS